MKIYVVSHKKAKLPKEDIYRQIFVGKQRNGDSKLLTDAVGDNISAKNPYYCELTALYWIWKNGSDDIEGLVHYRRYFFRNKFSKSFNNLLRKKDIEREVANNKVILPEKRYIKNANVKEHYSRHHNESDLIICRNIIKEKYPEYLQSFDTVMERRFIYPYNMIIAKKDLIDHYSEWLFDILFEAEKRIDLSEYDDYNKRVFGFLSERLLNVWIEKKYSEQVKEYYVANIEDGTFERVKKIIKEKIKKIEARKYEKY